MSKRYVFWKTLAGKPYRGADDKEAPNHILAEYGRTATVSSEKQISWINFNILQMNSLLKPAFLVQTPEGHELNDHDSWTILRTAITDTIRESGGRKSISPDFPDGSGLHV